jgi:hypothetical protein
MQVYNTQRGGKDRFLPSRSKERKFLFWKKLCQQKSSHTSTASEKKKKKDNASSCAATWRRSNAGVTAPDSIGHITVVEF